MAAQPDVRGTVMLSDQSSRRQDREAGVAEDVVGNEGPQLSQHPPCSRTSPDVEDQGSALVHQVVSPPLAIGRAVDLPARRQGGSAAGRRLVVDALELRQKGGEALLQQLHVVSLDLPGEERGRGQVGQEEDLGPLDGRSAVQVPTLITDSFVHPAHTRPGVPLGVVLQAVVEPLVETLAAARAAETLRRLAKRETVLFLQHGSVFPLPPAPTVRTHEAPHHSSDPAGPTQIPPTQGAGAVLPAHSVTVPHEEQQQAQADGQSADLALPDGLHPPRQHLPHVLQ